MFIVLHISRHKVLLIFFVVSLVTQKSDIMKEGYVVVNFIPTHIVTWGQWVYDKFDPQINEIVLVIAGNPGLAGFYMTFCYAIYTELEKKVPVWVIGHAGRHQILLIILYFTHSNFILRTR